MEALHPHFERAVSCLDQGDLEGLKQLISDFPELVHVSHPGAEEPYSGYFCGATLLHHVAFNPHRDQQMPGNIVDLTRVLLEAGADPNAICGGGPTQPNTGHGTVIGLIVSGSQGINKGHTEALVKLLMSYGAQLEYGESGVNLFGALYHTVENKKQREAAQIMYELGHDIDMVFAAGLGLLHGVQGYVAPNGQLKDDADRLFSHHRRDGLKKATDKEILQDCLLAASINNQLQVMGLLLSHFDLDINAYRAWGAWQVTPLHGACWSGWLEATRLLVERGADTMAHDPEHNSTPIGWAHYCGRQEVFDWFLPQDHLFGLFDAIEFDKPERFKTLLADQDPDMAIGEGQRGVLLRMAAHDGRLAMAEVLLAKGADPSLANSEGKTALFWAKKNQHSAIVELIEDYINS